MTKNTENQPKNTEKQPKNTQNITKNTEKVTNNTENRIKSQLCQYNTSIIATGLNVIFKIKNVANN